MCSTRARPPVCRQCACMCSKIERKGKGKGASVALKVFLVAQSLAGQEKLALRAELDACRAANRDENKAR